VAKPNRNEGGVQTLHVIVSTTCTVYFNSIEAESVCLQLLQYTVKLQDFTAKFRKIFTGSAPDRGYTTAYSISPLTWSTPNSAP